MLRIIVDSGSSIKPEEREKYGIDIVPMHVILTDKEYRDGVDLSNEEFYHALTVQKIFPKTSLPSMTEIEELVEKYTSQGDEVIILTLSSGLSGTYNTIKMLFEGKDGVRVIDSKSAAGGIRILVEEINKDRTRSIDEIEARLNDIIPRIRLLAIPETLEYLYRGGRLSKTGYFVGGMLGIIPIITVEDGKAVSYSKKRGLKSATRFILDKMDEIGVDKEHSIVAEYSYNRENVEKLIAETKEEYQKQITSYDNLSPTIASHWGPNAFGYFFVEAK